jgi:hypothetical protein
MKMKTKLVNSLFNHNSSSDASRGNVVGLLTLVAIFLCGFATTASAQWTELSTSPAGVNLAGIQVGTQAWGRDASGNVYEDIGGTFTLVAPSGTPAFTHITVGIGATPLWGLTAAGESYHYNGTSFVNIPLPSGETFDSIAAGASDEGIWAVNSATGHAFKYNSATNAWDAPPTGEPTEKFVAIDAGAYAIGPWAVDDKSGLWLFNSRTGFFDAVGGVPTGSAITQIAVGNGQTWVINEGTNNVYLYDENPAVEQFFHPNPFASPTFSSISESTDENLWASTSGGEVYLYNTSTLTFGLTVQPAEKIFEVKVGAAGVFALAQTTGHVYQFK